MKPFLATLSGQSVTPPPIWLMRQAGRYLPEYRAVRASAGSFLDLCYAPKLAAEVTLQPIRRFGFDAAIIFADILLVPQAMGATLSFAEGEGPRLSPVRDGAAVAALSVTRIRERLNPVFEALTLVRGSLPDVVSLIGFAGAPWTLATYLAEGQGSPDQREARLMSYRAPEEFQKLVDLLCEATIDYLSAQVEAGAEALQLFDSWASMLPEESFTRWVIEPTARIVAGVKAKAPRVPIIGFPRGARDLIRYAQETKVDAIALDTAVPPGFARDRLQPLLPVQGNLDPFALIAGGDVLEREVRRLTAALAGRPWVFNLGHGILPETPIAHVERLVELVRGTR
ncbi:MAG: uroporphyrinogen decarboxylase [Alphaproteobacteria bacterium]|nr:uroporphyrinogen decarboxylase [Alphaproteobacteria bacterium]